MIDYKGKDVTITERFYASLLERLKKALKDKRKVKWSKVCCFASQSAVIHVPLRLLFIFENKKELCYNIQIIFDEGINKLLKCISSTEKNNNN